MTSISVWTGNSEDTNLYFHMEQMKTCVPEAEPRFNINTVFPRCGIPMWKIRRPWDRLIFNMGIPILTSLFWNSSQISRAETSHYTPQYLRGVITYPCLLAPSIFFSLLYRAITWTDVDSSTLPCGIHMKAISQELCIRHPFSENTLSFSVISFVSNKLPAFPQGKLLTLRELPSKVSVKFSYVAKITSIGLITNVEWNQQ